MNASRAKELLARSVSSTSLQAAGSHTRPRSWGVYRIAQSGPLATEFYRFGNHPVRQTELHRAFGGAKLIALFTSRVLAAELAGIYNAVENGKRSRQRHGYARLPVHQRLSGERFP